MAKLLQWPTGKPSENALIEEHRTYLRTFADIQVFSNPPFEGLGWHYFLSDLDLMARAAKLTTLTNRSVAAVCDTIDALPASSIQQLLAARFAYFSPPSDDNDAQVAELLGTLSLLLAKNMLLRRKAVHLEMEAIEERKAVLALQTAERDKLRDQWRNCPTARLSTEPNDLLRWVQVQTPDTWHELIESWNYNNGGRLNSVLGWIIDQPNCDLSTAAKFFFTCAIGLADQEPSSLDSWYRGDWELMKRVADNWSRGLYSQAELRLGVDASDIRYYDDLVEQRNERGQPLAWKIPDPQSRRFGTRSHVSAYHFEHGHLSLSFATWMRVRDRFTTCGVDYPACCAATKGQATP
jgi:Domain of unknown function (DUF4274)